MKKSLIMFLFITMVLSLLLTGCGDDKKSSTDPGDPSDYDFTFGITEVNSDDREVEYYVAVFSNNDTEISSVAVTVNGYTYDLFYGYEGFIGSIILPDNGAYNYEVVINEDENFQFNLQPTFTPVVNWPEEYVLSEDLDLNWTLVNETNPDYQEFSAWASDAFGASDELYETVSNSDRSYTLPANWCPSEMDAFDFDLIVARYHITGELMIMSIGESSEYYNNYGEAKSSKLQLLKRVSNKISKM